MRSSLCLSRSLSSKVGSSLMGQARALALKGDRGEQTQSLLFTAAQEFEKDANAASALKALGGAAQMALADGSVDRAMEFGRKTLDLVYKHHDLRDQKASVERFYGSILMRGGDQLGGLEMMGKALSSTPTSDLANRGETVLTMAAILVEQSSPEAVKRAKEALRLFEDTGNVPRQIQAGILLGKALQRQHEYVESNNAFDNVLVLCESLPTSSEEWEAYAGMANNFSMMDDAHSPLAISSWRDALSTAEALDNAGLRSSSSLLLAAALLNTDTAEHKEEAIGLLKGVIALGTTSGDSKKVWQATTLLSKSVPMAERAEHLTSACDMARRMKDPHAIALALQELAKHYVEAKEPRLAEKTYGQALDEIQASGQTPLLKGIVLSELAMLYRGPLNDVDQAVEAGTQAVAVLDTLSGDDPNQMRARTLMTTLIALSSSLRTQGDTVKADDMLARAASWAKVLKDNGGLSAEEIDL